MSLILLWGTTLWIPLVEASLAYAQPPSEDATLIEGLRTRQLFDLAESYAATRIASGRLDARLRSEIAIQWLQTIADRAMSAEIQQRGDIWAHAHQVAAELQQGVQNNGYAILIRVQDALTFLAEGQILRQEIEAERASPSSRDLAIQRLREAADRFAEIDDELAKLIPERFRNPSSDQAPSANQLITLQNHVKFYRARALLNRALLYPTDDRLNRIDAINQVLSEFDQLLEKVDQNVSFWWDIQIDRVKCMRRLDELDRATSVLDQLPIDDATPRYQALVAAQSIMLAIDSSNIQDAINEIDARPDEFGNDIPQYKVARLAALLAAGNAKVAAVGQSSWRERALQLTKIIEHQHGPYWGRIANRLLLGSLPDQGVASADLLARVGDEAHRQGQFAEAIAAYQKGATAAKNDGDDSRWFDLKFKACMLLHQTQDYQAASEQLRTISLDQPKHERAAAAHILAAWQASQLASQQPDQLQRYIDLLTEHTEHWPKDATTNKALVWLGNLKKFRKEYSEAFDLLLRVDPSSEVFPTAVELIAQCADTNLREMRRLDQDLDGLAGTLATEMEQKAKSTTDQYGWSANCRELVTSAAEIRLTFGESQHYAAEQALLYALKAEGDRDPAWRLGAETLLLIALAGQPSKQQAAMDMVDKLTGLSVTNRIDLMAQLSHISDQPQRGDSQVISTLVLQISEIDPAEIDELTDDQFVTFNLLRADAQDRLGQREATDKSYAELIDRFPQDGRVRLAYAEHLTADNNKHSLAAALDQWRIIARGSRPQSDRWFQAKYHVAQTLHRLDRSDESARLLRYLKETPPGWEQSKLRADFESLLRECRE